MQWSINTVPFLSPACGRGDYKTPSVHASVRQVFAQTLIYHPFIKIFSPNLQGMFMAMKTCLYKILASFGKTKWPP